MPLFLIVLDQAYMFVSCHLRQETWDKVYFIKQIESLGNACGTIALLHAVGNTFSESSLCKFALYFCPSGLQFFRLLKSLGGAVDSM